VTLQGDGKFEITQSKYRLSEEQKNGDGQKLFDFCAECLKTFVETNVGSDQEGPIKDGHHLPLGFTVSFLLRFIVCDIRDVDISHASYHVSFSADVNLLGTDHLVSRSQFSYPCT
jgi:hypothetical protein